MMCLSDLYDVCVNCNRVGAAGRTLARRRRRRETRAAGPTQVFGDVVILIRN